MHLSSYFVPHPAGQRFSAPIRRYVKPGLKWVTSITQQLIFMAVILLRENLDLNLIQLNSTKNAFCVLSILKPRDTKMSKTVLSLENALSPGEKGDYYAVKTIIKERTK